MSLKFDIQLADLKVNIDCRSDFVRHFCKDYLIENDDSADIYATADEEAIAAECKAVPKSTYEYCETLCVYRSIAEQLPKYNRFVFHGASIEYDGKAYLFTAPSGTGKTTHISLWKKNLGEKIRVINGDKPIIKADKTSVVYGTPWAGKENLQNNISAPLAAVCIIKRAKENKISQISKSQAINHLMSQMYLPHSAEALSKALSLLGKLIENTPVYMLECDISNEAFKTSFEKLINHK